jgi:hypothetical protein
MSDHMPIPEDRPNTAPAYYLGHPARLWIAVATRRRAQREPPKAMLMGRTIAGVTSAGVTTNRRDCRYPDGRIVGQVTRQDDSRLTGRAAGTTFRGECDE